jgi:prevent-host-death family protein
MSSIATTEAPAQFESLIERVEHGEEITITRGGAPIAKLIPISRESGRPIKDVIAEMREIQKHGRLDGLSVREMIEEGRRY